MSERQSWFDEKTQEPRINEYARKMSGYVDAMADGVVEEKELQQQEQRLVALMKEIEPQLDDEMHAKITELLCELTAYDLMQILHALQKARPTSTFVG